MTFHYREDIDWLRGIAVLAVVAFHFETPAIYGGFVGVDIFFVISGYLITGIIQSEIKADTFSFARFYERRVRRLLPALYAMVALTAIPTFHFLLTSERAEFFRSVVSVATFTSNFFFWFQTGYFDHAAVEKPLLHTWSLAVEEQFYLALPLLLFLLARFARGRAFVFPLVLGALTIASFALAVWLMRHERSANAFFMSPPRAWEFLAGGLVALPGFPLLRGVLAQRIARGVALVLLAIPIFGLRQGPGFPGVNALSPVLGSAIFIWSGIGVPTLPRSPYSPLNAATFFGRISYIRVVLLGPAVQFRARLPSMLARAQLRGVDALPEDMLLPNVFSFDLTMRKALPNTQNFHYVSVVNAVCPERHCPLTVDDDVPLAWDHAHLTAEGSIYVSERLLPLLGLN